jgi:glycosyltransferase involved in cell wall biosynthesis
LRKLKIAQVTPYYFPSVGGVSTQAKYIADELSNRGHDVDVITAYKDHASRPKLQVPKKEDVNGVHVYRYISILNIGHMSIMPGLVTHFIKHRYDVIHYHSYRHPLCDISAFFGRLKSSVNVMQGQGPFFEPGEISGLKKMLYESYDIFAKHTMLRFSDLIFALNEYEKERYYRILKDDKKLKIIPSAAEGKSYIKNDPSSIITKYGLENKKVILFVGNLDDNKRPDLLVKALPGIKKSFPEILLLFAGRDEGMQAICKNLAKELNVSENIKFLGFISDEDKHLLYDATDVFALVSDKESFGTVLVEAMAHQLPVVVTDARGPKSVVKNGVNGLVINRDDSKALTEAIINILSDEALKKSLAQNARKSAEDNFRIESIVDKIESYYFDIINMRQKN